MDKNISLLIGMMALNSILSPMDETIVFSKGIAPFFCNDKKVLAPPPTRLECSISGARPKKIAQKMGSLTNTVGMFKECRAR